MIGGAKGIGLGIDLGLVNQYNRTGSQSYIEPEVLDSLVGVWSAYGMTNDSPNRSTIKNKLSNKGGDFVISNAAYDKMSSYGGYEFAKFDNTLDWYNTEGNDSVEVVSRNGHSITLKRLTGPNFWYFQNATFRGLISNVIPFKVNSNKNITVIWDVHGLSISEGKDKSVKVQELVLNPNEDNYTNLKTLNEEELAQIDISTNSLYYLLWFDLSTLAVDEEVTIEMLPLFEGAFVTDGVNDLITSTKTVQEMLGGSTEFTTVSMIHLISPGQDVDGAAYTNYIRTSDNYWTSNRVSNIDKTGIYGYSFKQGTTTVINNILGDKNDYTVEKTDDVSEMFRAKFSIEGFEHVINGAVHVSSVAWYWTIIANKVLTSDQINQVIAYYDLDKYLEPTVLYNVKRQGLSNDTPTSEWYLKDYSKNGYDMTLNNFSKAGGSGIAAKQGESIKDYSIIKDEEYQELTIYNEFKFKIKSKLSGRYWTVQYINRTNTSYPVTIVIDKDAYWVNSTTYYDADNNKQVIRKDIPIAADTPIDVLCCGYDQFDIPEDATSIVSAVSYINYNAVGEITVELIPSCEGGLITDGVNDFGKVTGLPAYKDYTTIIDYQRFDIGYIEGKGTTGILSKAHAAGQGAFLMNLIGSTGTHMNSYSFGTANANTYADLDRQIYYQTKYKMQGFDMTAGTGVDGDSMWLALVRDNDSRFFNGAIYSLMSFPYSMSEFLIERQLKKHKLGTLYPDMVEWRPVIKSSVELASKPTFVIRGTSTLLNAGDYIPENSEIWVVITMNNAADRITKFVINGNTVDIPSSAYNPSTMKYGFPFTIDSKSPQKITMTIEQDENYVQWNPVVTSNVEYNKLDFYLNNYQKRINIGDYIPKDAYLRANLYLKNNVDELTVFTFNGVNIGYRRSSVDDTAFNINQIYNYDSPQEVNITVDEYIRYEDIVQPYPSFVKLENLDRTHTYTWGDKLKVGDTIRYNSSVNLLEGAYTLKGQLECNGVYVYDNNQYITVAKEMIFAWTNSPIWSIDDNEPKCILSPRLLRIPNSSYKILGYIPDISGHGNHGVIHNSAYAGASGANGYKQDFTSWKTNGSGYSIVTDSKYILTNEKAITNGGYFLWNRLAKDSFKVKISNIPNGGWMSYRYKVTEEDTQFSSLFIREDGIYTLPATIADSEVDFFISTVSAPAEDWIGLTIEQIGEYDGAYCLDGVDDFVTIPTTVGGKQVLMKVNWQSIAGTAILYDQRTNGGFAIFNRDFDTNENKVPAYRARNIGGSTYIDGILNEYIYASELKDITHNIVELCDPELNTGTLNPKIGSSYLNSNYTQMSLYDFMLFDEISTDDKILELNEYVGIEGNTE